MADFADRMKQKRQDQAAAAGHKEVVDAVKGVGDRVIAGAKANIQAMDTGEHKVAVPELSSVVDALNKQTLSMLVLHDPKLQEAAQNLKAVVDEISNTASKFKNLNDLSAVLRQLLEEMKALPDKVAATDKSGDLVPHIQSVANAVSQQKAPVVNAATKVDLSPVVKKLDELMKSMPKESDGSEDQQLLSAVNAVSDAIGNLKFPVANFELPFKIKNTTGNSTDKTNYTSTQVSAVTSTDDATLTGLVALNPDGSKIGGAAAGGTQYTDGSATIAHPIGTIPVYDNAGTITAVSATNRLPVTANAGTGTFTVGGTVTANAGTNLNTSLLALESGGNLATIVTNTAPLNLAQASTTSGQKGNLVMGAVTTAKPTYTTAQTNPLSLDVNGLLRISLADTPVNGTALSVSGTVTANAGTNLNTSLLALETGGNLASIKTDVDNLNLAQASTTSGQKGNLILGAVTTAAPTYTTAQSNPLSLTVAGLLRVDGSGVTQPVSLTSTTITGTVAVTESGTWNVGLTAGSALVGKFGIDQTTVGTTNAVSVAQIGANTVLTGNGVTGTGSLRVTIASDNSVLPAVGAGATASAVPANASYAGGNAITSLPTAATAGNTTGVSVDKFGRQVVIPGTIRDLIGTQTTTISASTAETTVVTAGAAGVFNDLMMLIISNTSTATNTRIDFRDTTAGTVLFSLESIGGAAPVGFSLGGVAIPQTGAATNWTAQCATSTTDIRIYAVFAKNK